MKCEYCGNDFVPHDKRQVFCCKRCKDNASKVRRGIKPVSERTITCPECGTVFNTVNSRRMYCSRQCRERKYYEHTGDEILKIRKEKAEGRRKIKALEKQWLNAMNTVERECVVCGTLFYCLKSSKKKTCSAECSRKNHVSSDKRIPKAQIVDRDITLNRLYKRDNGICWICGGLCDFNDHAVAKSGYIYPGENYPEIEHVIPVSRGGLHSWDNVRLAHRKCNAIKKDDIYPFTPLDKEFAYQEKRVGNQAKKTAQYNLDGSLIRIWNSTGEIQRELGLNSKTIQSACKRRKTRTGNAFGFHWEYVT